MKMTPDGFVYLRDTDVIPFTQIPQESWQRFAHNLVEMIFDPLQSAILWGFHNNTYHISRAECFELMRFLLELEAQKNLVTETGTMMN